VIPYSEPIYIFTDRVYFLVFDVMLQSISSPRREAASPPHQDVPNSQNADTLRDLQIHFGTCRYTSGLADTLTYLGFSLTNGPLPGGHGQYSNGWGRRVTQFSCLGFLGSILHSSFLGADSVKRRVFLTQIASEVFHGAS
jgi:hypothetical protein